MTSSRILRFNSTGELFSIVIGAPAEWRSARRWLIVTRLSAAVLAGLSSAALRPNVIITLPPASRTAPPTGVLAGAG
ncbi:MAG TPA: hypothetical protein VEU98_05240 [Candidatus Eremiobacteraceae bacterium]|nr:hypothetical protein [Candidatus Eremiobacteraceae bacterium]